MIITTSFQVDAPLDVVWRYLLDVPRIAPCVPGAQLTSVIDDRTYEGKIQVKLGPITVDYKGQVKIDAIDEAAHTVNLKANGVESRGRGGAVASVRSELHAEGGRTVVTMQSDVAVSGLVAQFGRSAIMQDVSQRLAQQFAGCLEQQLKAAPAGPLTAASDAPSPRSATAAAVPVAAAVPAAAAAKPVSAFRLAWEVIRAGIGRLVRRR